MSISGSSLRIAGPNSLLKIGGLAAIAYILFKRITGMQPSEKTTLQRTTRPHERSYTAEGGASVRKIKIDSPGSSTSSAVHYGQSDLAKGHTITITGGEESEVGKYLQRPKTVSLEPERAIPPSAVESQAAQQGESLDEESPAHILASVKEPETMQALDDTLSRTAHVEGAYAEGELSPERGLDIERDEKWKKIAAIEAIECMAAEGNQEAKSLLFKHVQSEDFSIRHEAIRGILQHGGREDRELLQRTLPAGDWYIMDIRPEDMRRVC